MTSKEREKIIQKLLKECRKIRMSKGIDYSGSKDANRNFKRAGKAIGVSPEKACWIYLLKHQDAISTWMRKGKLKGEAIEEKIKDNVNYLLILYSLIKEKQKETLTKEDEYYNKGRRNNK